jgi:hypothetical protein
LLKRAGSHKKSVPQPIPKKVREMIYSICMGEECRGGASDGWDFSEHGIFGSMLQIKLLKNKPDMAPNKTVEA